MKNATGDFAIGLAAFTSVVRLIRGSVGVVVVGRVFLESRDFGGFLNNEYLLFGFSLQVDGRTRSFAAPALFCDP